MQMWPCLAAAPADEARASLAEKMREFPASLTLCPWVLLRGFDHDYLLSPGSIAHLSDLRCLLGQKLVTLGRAVPWYHRMP